MQALDQRLQADGLKKDVPAGNSGNRSRPTRRFRQPKRKRPGRCWGRKNSVSAVALAFRRPYVAGFRKEMPMGRGTVLGRPEPAGTVRWRL